jgi:hypothetical protein
MIGPSKILTIGTAIILFSSILLAQEEMKAPQSTYEQFLSGKGTMITKDFFEMPPLQSSYQKLSVKVVRLAALQTEKLFLTFTAEAKYSDKQAAIVYDDLLEVDKALETIAEKSQEDQAQDIGYRERYFVTNDGFKIGYFQSGSKQTVFIELDDYQTDDTFFFNSFQPLFDTFAAAKVKMGELKK